MRGKKEEIVPIRGQVVQKANAVIFSLSDNTLLSNKVFLAALLKAEKRENTTKPVADYYLDLQRKTKADYAHGLVAEISNGELRAMMQTKSGSYYNEIDALLNGDKFLDNWKIIYKDKDISATTAMISACAYDSRLGKLFIKFNPDVEDIVFGLSTNYTKLDPDYMMILKSLFSFRIYEILKASMDYKRSVTKSEGPYLIEFNISHLKFLTSALNPKATLDTEDMLKSTAPDYDYIADQLPENTKAYIRYTDFKRYGLDTAQKEINKKTDISFTYEPVRAGQGGKVTSVAFTCHRKNVKTKEPEHYSEYDMIDVVRGFTGDDFSSKDIAAMIKTADKDLSKIKAAYELMKTKENIRDTTAWMIDAIQKGYTAGKEQKEIKALKKNAFNTFEQRDDYDFDAIEKQALDAQTSRVEAAREQAINQMEDDGQYNMF